MLTTHLHLVPRLRYTYTPPSPSPRRVTIVSTSHTSPISEDSAIKEFLRFLTKTRKQNNFILRRLYQEILIFWWVWREGRGGGGGINLDLMFSLTGARSNIRHRPAILYQPSNQAHRQVITRTALLEQEMVSNGCFIEVLLQEIQGGSNMTGTNCDLFTHKQSRSYLNHLVHSMKESASNCDYN